MCVSEPLRQAVKLSTVFDLTGGIEPRVPDPTGRETGAEQLFSCYSAVPYRTGRVPGPQASSIRDTKDRERSRSRVSETCRNTRRFLRCSAFNGRTRFAAAGDKSG